MFKWERVDLNAPSDRADFVKQWALKLVDPFMKQTTGKLARNNGSRCCLGVATYDVAKLPMDKTGHRARDALAMPDGNIDTLPLELYEFLEARDLGDVIRYIPLELKAKVKENLKEEDSLAAANDSGVPFLKIAQVITEYPRAFFLNLTPEEEAYILAVRPTLPTREKLRAQKKQLKRASGEDSGKEGQA